MPIYCGKISVEKIEKGFEIMNDEKMLEILERIRICLNRNSVDVAKELVNLEIDNLNGNTEKKCKNTKYHFYNSYCKYCDNVNCLRNMSN